MLVLLHSVFVTLSLKYAGDVLIVLERSPPLYTLNPFLAWWGLDSSSVELTDQFPGFVSAPCMIWHRNAWCYWSEPCFSAHPRPPGFRLCQNPTDTGNVPKPRPISCGACPENTDKIGLCSFNRPTEAHNDLLALFWTWCYGFRNQERRWRFTLARKILYISLP